LYLFVPGVKEQASRLSPSISPQRKNPQINPTNLKYKTRTREGVASRSTLHQAADQEQPMEKCKDSQCLITSRLDNAEVAIEGGAGDEGVDFRR